LSVTILLCLVALGLVGCRQPVRRVHLSRLALVCALVLLPLVAWSPLPPIPVVTLLRSALGGGEPVIAPLADDVSGSEASEVGDVPAPVRWAGLHFGGMPRAALVLVPAYVAGVAAGSAWLLLGYWGLGWLSRGARAPAAETLALYEALPWDRRRARPALRVSDRVSRPVLVGAFRPAILIPGGLDRPGDPTALRLSLLHELAHAETRDPLFNLVGRLGQVLWFFLPPVWWIRAQLALDHEFLADRRAAAKFGHLSSYASSLLGMASPPQAREGSSTGAEDAAGLTGSALVQRVLMLVKCPFPVEARPPAWWLRSLTAVVVAVTLATSALRLRASAVEPGEAGAGPSVAASRAQPHTFRLSRLTIPARPPGGRRRGALFELPVRLPPAFELTLHVWGTPTTLADTRVAGLRLGTPDDLLRAFAAPPVWHLVYVRRESAAGPVTVKVDDRPVPVNADHRAAVTTWLSVEPAPNTEGQFQHLKLTW
jgi:hypothetical protein